MLTDDQTTTLPSCVYVVVINGNERLVTEGSGGCLKGAFVTSSLALLCYITIHHDVPMLADDSVLSLVMNRN